MSDMTKTWGWLGIKQNCSKNRPHILGGLQCFKLNRNQRRMIDIGKENNFLPFCKMLENV
jgi:hypothetical protein